MPSVPVYQSRVDEQRLSTPQVPTEAPPSAFNLGQSRNQLDQAQVGLLETGAKIAADYRQKVSDVQTEDFKAQTVAYANDLKFGDDGAFKKKQLAAAGVTEDYGDRYRKKVAEMANSIPDEYTRSRYQAIANGIGADLHGDLERHTFQEHETYNKNALASSLDTHMQDAVLNYQSPGAVEKSIENQRQALEAQRGTSDINVDETLAKTRSATYAAVLNRMLINDQPGAAAQKFQEWRPGMQANDADNVEKAIEASKTVAIGNNLWNDVSSFTLADGSPDQAKMEAYVMSQPGLSLERKERAWEHVKAKAGEAHAQTVAQTAATERDFADHVVQARTQGVSLDNALKLSTQYGDGSYDQAVKADFVRKTYADPNAKSDETTKFDLWQGIKLGTVTPEDIDKARDQGKLSPSDWVQKRQEYFNAQLKAEKPETKNVWDRVGNFAVENGMKKNSDDYKTFLNVLREKSQGKSVDQIWVMAQDEIKSQPGTGWHLFGGFGGPEFGQKPTYKQDSQTIAARSAALGIFQNDLGNAPANAILQGLKRKGVQDPQPADIDAFAVQFGGYDNIKPGTTVHNAILSIMAHKKPVTVENINAGLAVHPDGKW